MIVLPNIRKLFVPDKGYMMFEADLSGADAQVVAWEADDEELKRWLREGVDMHVRHCAEIGGETQIHSLDPKSHAYYKLRQSYKHATHAIHYVGSARAMSSHPSIGWSISKSEQYKNRYLLRRPGIREWHKRTEIELQKKRTTTNRFEYRIIYFDRIEGLLPQAIAWIPQSTVALVCFKGAIQLERKCPWVEILLQVHDSLVFQVPFHKAERYSEILDGLSVPVPYSDPLVIPWGLSRSEKSWGDCEKVPKELLRAA
jgi:DNA polymerase I-like protein with 3'-5' exonuclease and polymerase domains